MADVKRPMLFGVGVAVVALLSAGLAVWSILRVAGAERAQTRIEQRVIHDERPPTQRQLLQAILRALAVCHANRACGRALEQAKQGRSPTGGTPGASPGSPAFPQPGSPGAGQPAVPPAPGANDGQSRPTPAPAPDQTGPTGSSPSPQPQPQPGPQPQPPVPLPGPLKPVGPVVCGLAPRLCR